MITKYIVDIYKYLMKSPFITSLNENLLFETFKVLSGTSKVKLPNELNLNYGKKLNIDLEKIRNYLFDYISLSPRSNQSLINSYDFIKPDYFEMLNEIYDYLVAELEMAPDKATNLILYFSRNVDLNRIPFFGAVTISKNGEEIKRKLESLIVEYKFVSLSIEDSRLFYSHYHNYLETISKYSRFNKLNDLLVSVSTQEFTPFKFNLTLKILLNYLKEKSIISYTNSNNFYLTDKGVKLGFQVNDKFNLSQEIEVSYLKDNFELIRFVSKNLFNIFYHYYGSNPLTQYYNFGNNKSSFRKDSTSIDD
jgi:hypothetical protein